MGLCYEFDTGCCGCPVRSTVCTGLCHYMLQGLLIVSFAFTNISYPAYEYSDYLYGGGGAALLGISFLTAWTVDLEKYQFIRFTTGALTTAAVLFHIGTTYYYTVVRWDDVMVTALSSAFRKSSFVDFPDPLWYTITVLTCLTAPLFLTYLVYIISFMCNRWKSYLFMSPYQNNPDVSGLPTIVNPATLPPDMYSGREYKPYPVQNIPRT